ncbi:MAG: hypothetical protein ABID61_06480 [Candidatus Micrarchaeota archaeon]
MSFTRMVLIGLLFSGIIFATTAKDVVPDLSGYTTKTEQVLDSNQRLYGAGDGISKCNLSNGYVFQKVNLGEDIEIAGIVFQCTGNNQDKISVDIIDSLRNRTTSSKKSMIVDGVTIHYFEENVGFPDSYAAYYYYNNGDMHVELACVDSANKNETNCKKVLEKFVSKTKGNISISCCFSMTILAAVLMLAFKANA